MRPLLVSLLFFPLLLTPALSREAQAGEPLWQRATSDNADYKTLLAAGDEFAGAAASARARALRFGHASRSGSSQSRSSEALAQSLARKALDSYELAAKAAPTKEEPHYRAGEVLSAFMLDENISAPSALDRAIKHWRQFEKKAPLDPRLLTVLDSRSIALTKRGGKKNLLAAVVDYDRQLDLIDQSSDARRVSIARLLSNRAELHMMLGDLQKSIDGYERALSFHLDTVYGYGLAVALDRDKQAVRARSIARTYAETDSSDALTRNGTFFVPPGERFYYIAIRAEGLKDYRAAVSAYKEFRRLLPNSPWAGQALANIKELAPRAAKQPKVKPKPPHIKSFNWIP